MEWGEGSGGFIPGGNLSFLGPWALGLQDFPAEDFPYYELVVLAEDFQWISIWISMDFTQVTIGNCCGRYLGITDRVPTLTGHQWIFLASGRAHQTFRTR